MQRAEGTSRRDDFDSGSVCGPDGNGHPADADGKRVPEQEPATVQRLHLRARLKPQATQTVRLGFPKARPINVGNPRDLFQRQLIELHPRSSFIQTQLQLIIIFLNKWRVDSGGRITQAAKESGRAEMPVARRHPFRLGLLEPHDAVYPSRQKGAGIGPVLAVVIDEYQQRRSID